MDYCEIRAAPPLDTVVRCFWFLRGDTGLHSPQTIVADGCLELIVHLANPLSRVDDDGGIRTQESVLAAGQLTAPLYLVGRGELDVVGVRFRPAAAATVLRIPLAELTNRVEPLATFAPRLASALHTAAARHTEPLQRAEAMSTVLIRFATRAADPLALAATAVLDSGATPRVGHVASHLGVSGRTLERAVLEHAGLSPATLRRVFRFRRAFNLLDTAPAGSWSRVAAEAGYFDQSHLIREFRQFAGATPGEFFRTDPEFARAVLSNTAPSP